MSIMWCIIGVLSGDMVGPWVSYPVVSAVNHKMGAWSLEHVTQCSWLSAMFFYAMTPVVELS